MGDKMTRDLNRISWTVPEKPGRNSPWRIGAYGKIKSSFRDKENEN